MRRLPFILLALTLAGCGGSDPAAPASASTVLPNSFTDEFSRPDTPAGLGDGYDMRGAYVSGYPLPPATDGFIKDGAFTYAGKSVVYASRHLPFTATRIGTVGRFKALPSSTAIETALALGVSSNANLISDMGIHFTATRWFWTLSIVENGVWTDVALQYFDPVLSIETDYTFEAEVKAGTITIRVPGGDFTFKNDKAASLLGPYVFWEEYPNTATPAAVFNFDRVWAYGQ